MRVDEMMPLIEEAVQVGYMQAVKSYEPWQDEIRKTDVLRWLRFMRIDTKIFTRLVEKGMVKPFRKGVGTNSPLYYSKVEIKRAMMALKIEI